MCLEFAPTADEYFVYFGTYTGFTYMNEGLPAGGSRSKGIYVSRFQPATGELSKPELAAEIVNPAFLAVLPTSDSFTSRRKTRCRWARTSITRRM